VEPRQRKPPPRFIAETSYEANQRAGDVHAEHMRSNSGWSSQAPWHTHAASQPIAIPGMARDTASAHGAPDARSPRFGSAGQLLPSPRSRGRPRKDGTPAQVRITLVCRVDEQ
jgi:hypothetical protein